jgi:hypothetical protein
MIEVTYRLLALTKEHKNNYDYQLLAPEPQALCKADARNKKPRISARASQVLDRISTGTNFAQCSQGVAQTCITRPTPESRVVAGRR